VTVLAVPTNSGTAVDDETQYTPQRETTMSSAQDTVDLLEELQRAASEHRKILERQSELIRRLRNELKDVRR
jgi:dsDNA-specific endonuclease/ATPase MutS2